MLVLKKIKYKVIHLILLISPSKDITLPHLSLRQNDLYFKKYISGTFLIFVKEMFPIGFFDVIPHSLPQYVINAYSSANCSYVYLF